MKSRVRTDRIVMPGRMRFSFGLTISLLYLLLIALSAAGLAPASSQSNSSEASLRLQAGIEKEDADGDLPSAIEIYQKIAADTSAARSVRAAALLRLAGCEEKLGRSAVLLYEQIVRDYQDQPAAAQARKRLAALKQQQHPPMPKTMTVRKIDWSKLGFMGSGDTDGEHAIYEAGVGNLYYSDLSGRNRRLIFSAGMHLGSSPSRDLSLVALGLHEKPGRPPTIAVIKNDGTGYRELLHDDAEGSLLGGTMLGVTVNWSWDNRAIVVSSRTVDGGSHLLVIDLASGHHEEVAKIDKGQFWSARFSPDGRFLAYGILPDTKHAATGTSRIYVKPVRGGPERLIYESAPLDVETYYDALKDWTADGRYIAFKDIRNGLSALYLQPMQDGAPIGASIFVRSGGFIDGNITTSGALIYQDLMTSPTLASAYVARLDSNQHVEGWQTIQLQFGLDIHSHPWRSLSPDGTHIAYIAAGEDDSHRSLILQEIATGKQRVIYELASKNVSCQFSATNPKIFCSLDFRTDDRTELISIAVDSGTVEKLVSFAGSRFILDSPLDDRVFYFSGNKADLASVNRDEIEGPPILSWDRVTGKETVLVPAVRPYFSEQLTRDGRWLIRNKDWSLSMKPITGGDWKPIVSDFKGGLKWTTTPDGKWIIYHTIDARGEHGIFKVPITGGTPQRLGDFPSNGFHGSMIRVSADGRRLLVSDMQITQYDLWILENFEPDSKY